MQQNSSCPENKKNVSFVSVVVPVYNEEGCLQELIDRTLNVLKTTEKRFELILIDDGSRDQSREIIGNAAEKNPDEVIGVFLNRNYGQHSAILAGFDVVRGDLIITIDADLQNPPEEIPSLIIAAEKGNDVVGTVRMNRQDTFFRRYASKIINYVTQQATGVYMQDYGCMLRAYRRHVVEAMKLCRERSTFIPVLANMFARNTCEIPVRHCERAVGESKYSVWKLINLQFNLLTCITTFPLRVMTYVGVGVSCFGFLLGIYILMMRILMGSAWSVDGIFTLFAFGFIISGIQLIGIGLVGEYVGRIYYDVRARPRYFVDKVVGHCDEKNGK